jgi:hypothetical protein
MKKLTSYMGYVLIYITIGSSYFFLVTSLNT